MTEEKAQNGSRKRRRRDDDTKTDEFSPNPFLYDDGEWLPEDPFGLFQDGLIHQSSYAGDAQENWIRCLIRECFQTTYLSTDLVRIVFGYYICPVDSDGPTVDAYWLARNEQDTKNNGCSDNESQSEMEEQDSNDDTDDENGTDSDYVTAPVAFLSRGTAKRLRPGDLALRTIKRQQDSTELLLPKRSFFRLCQDLATHALLKPETSVSDASSEVGDKDEKEKAPEAITVEAVCALQHAAEDFLIQKFQAANKHALHAKRVTVLPVDLWGDAPPHDPRARGEEMDA